MYVNRTAISGGRIVTKKEAEKIIKYKNLATEIQRTCSVKTEVMPVILGATGTISQSLGQYLSNMPGKHEIKELQKRPYWALYIYFGKY